MLGIIRLGAYFISGLTIWQFFQSGSSGTEMFPLAKHLALDSSHGMIFGVCAGVSNYTGIDVTIIRLLWALSAIYRGVGVGLYILAFLIMPAS